MKVLSYLELMEDVAKLNSKNIPNYFGYASAMEFYSQPFKPELITELFEGWEWNDEYGDFKDLVNTTTKNCHWLGINEFPDNIRTLDDFINDCQRAGIELEWREKK